MQGNYWTRWWGVCVNFWFTLSCHTCAEENEDTAVKDCKIFGAFIDVICTRFVLVIGVVQENKGVERGKSLTLYRETCIQNLRFLNEAMIIFVQNLHCKLIAYLCIKLLFCVMKFDVYKRANFRLICLWNI